MPAWYWTILALLSVVIAACLRDMWLFARESRRWCRLFDERRARTVEDKAWAVVMRERDAEIALAVRRQRLARLKRTDPDAFATAVRLAACDSRGADLLIAEATA